MTILYRRRLTYSRALEIVQDEEYLTEADRDIIRRRGGRRRSHRRVKRQFPFLNVSVVPDATDDGGADIELTGAFLAAFGAAGASQVVMSAGIGQPPPPPPQPAQPPLLTSSALPGQVFKVDSCLTYSIYFQCHRYHILPSPGRRGDPADGHLGSGGGCGGPRARRRLPRRLRLPALHPPEDLQRHLSHLPRGGPRPAQRGDDAEAEKEPQESLFQPQAALFPEASEETAAKRETCHPEADKEEAH